MDLTFTEKENLFRADAREWLEAEVPRKSLGSGDTRDGFRAHVEWEKRLFDGGWSVVSWPKAYGGRDASLTEWLIFEEEYYRAGAPNRVTQNGIFLLAPTVFSYGSPEQKERFLRPMASAEVLWCQGWSEPNAGSDLANVKSHAVSGDGGWYLTGQKTWCTRGAFCDAIYGLFRTDPDSNRHRGLSYFLIPFDRPGVTVRGMGRLDGDEGFAEVFFDEVFVTSDDLLGDVNQGWAVAMSTTSSERGLSLRSPGRFMASVSKLRQLLYRNSDTLDPTLAARLAEVWIKVDAYRLYTYRSVAKMKRGHKIGAESSLNKLFWSQMDIELHEIAMDLLGEEGLIEEGDRNVDAGSWLKGFQFSLAGPIYAGTNEIQKNLVAQRVLGLPRK